MLTTSHRLSCAPSVVIVLVHVPSLGSSSGLREFAAIPASFALGNVVLNVLKSFRVDAQHRHSRYTIKPHLDGCACHAALPPLGRALYWVIDLELMGRMQF